MSKTRQAFVIDIEADNLYPYVENVWIIVIKKVGTNESLSLYPYRGGVDVKQSIIDFISPYENPIISFHNGLGYDAWVLWKSFGMKISVGPDALCGIPVEYFDTMYASQFLLPDREGGHSLKSWGIRHGDYKIDFRELCIEDGIIDKKDPKGAEFKQYSPRMDEYCEKDCLITERVLNELYAQIMHEDVYTAFKLGQKTFFLMCAQAFTGFKFDRNKALELQPRIQMMIQDLKDEIEPNLPSRSLKKTEQSFYTVPKKPYKQDGEFSKTMLNWIERHEAVALSNVKLLIYGVEILFSPGMILNVRKPMNLEDQNALKEWFLEQGWQPTMWNVKKDPKTGKALRDEHKQLIPTSPKIQENGKICPNLLELDGELPAKVVRFLSLRNRLGVLSGWLNHERLDWDGRIPAGSSGIASTHRQKHTTVVNVPKAQDDVLLGKEFRSLWIVDEGNHLVGCDQAALEARCEGHWTYKYDGGESARELIDGDPHCFDQETKILCEDGEWKSFGELSYSDKVAQWDEGEVKFVFPNQRIWQDYTGKMIKVSGQNLDMLLTLNHRVIYVDRRNPEKSKTILANDLNNRNSDQRIPSSGTLYSFPKGLDTDQIRLIVAVQADANISKSRAIRFTFVKQRKCERLEQILHSCNIEYKKSFQERKGRLEHRYYIPFKQLNFSLFDYIGPEKSFTKEVMYLGLEERLIFIDELKYWDGTIKKNEDVVLDSRDEYSIQICKTICDISGIASSYSSFYKYTHFGNGMYYRLYISNNKKPWYGTLNKSIEVVDYNGKIGCVVVPSGMILVRRGDCTFVSGNSKNAKAFFPKQTEAYDINSDSFDKDDPGFKPFRGKSKNGKYAVTYGSAPKKLAATLGLPESRGKELFDAFWEANPALKKLKDGIESFWINKTKKTWIPGIDGRKLYSRSQHSLVNLLFQSTGAIIVDYSLCLFDKQMGGLEIDELGRPYYDCNGYVVKRVQYTHDEYGVECPAAISGYIAELMEWTMAEAGVKLNLKIPLVGEAKIGNNWAETH